MWFHVFSVNMLGGKKMTFGYVFLLLHQSQTRQEWPGHGAPGLQDCRGAKGQPVIHSDTGGLLEAGEVCMDQWHQPGMSTRITLSGSRMRSRGCQQKACTLQHSLCPPCLLLLYLSYSASTTSAAMGWWWMLLRITPKSQYHRWSSKQYFLYIYTV